MMNKYVLRALVGVVYGWILPISTRITPIDGKASLTDMDEYMARIDLELMIESYHNEAHKTVHLLHGYAQKWPTWQKGHLIQCFLNITLWHWRLFTVGVSDTPFRCFNSLKTMMLCYQISRVSRWRKVVLEISNHFEIFQVSSKYCCRDL